MSDGLRPPELEVLRRLPKAELHCHLDGSVRPETLLDLGRKRGVSMPRGDARALREYMAVDDARSLEDYLQRFEVTLSVMQRADAIERIAYELAEDAHRDGVFYLEVRFSPLLNSRAGLKEHEAVEAAVAGLKRAEGDYGIIGRVIVTAMRTLPPEMSLEMARLAVAYRHQGVAAVAQSAASVRAGPRHLSDLLVRRTRSVSRLCGDGFGVPKPRRAGETGGAD